MEKNINKRDLFHSLASLVAFIITILINYGTSAGLFGMTQVDISNQYENLLTPSSTTFSIWGLIYTLILIFLIYQIYLVVKDNYNSDFYNKLNVLFIISCVFNILWNIFWVRDSIGISTVLIILFAITLGLINYHILKNYDRIYSLITPVAFALYFGWLTVASITNIVALMVKNQSTIFGMGEYNLAILGYVLIVILAGLIIFNIKNYTYNLPIIWAFIGIYNNVDNILNNEGFSFLKLIIIIAIVILAGQSIYVLIKNNFKILAEKV